MRASASDSDGYSSSNQTFESTHPSPTQTGDASSDPQRRSRQPRMRVPEQSSFEPDDGDFDAASSANQHDFTVTTLIGQLHSLNKGSLAKRLGDILNLFESLKCAQYTLADRLYDWFDDAELNSLSFALSTFLQRFSDALASSDASTRIDPADLNHEHIQTVCQGLAACAPTTSAPLWTAPDDCDRVRRLTDQLLEQALALGLPESVQANDEVLSVLNWISRGLKSGLLVTNDTVTELFQQSLPLIAAWTGGDQCHQLISDHNLGKCAVQVSTLVNHIPLDWKAKVSESPGQRETQGSLLQRCILNLCSDAVLTRLTTKPIDTIALVNVCNLVKDGLSSRRLSAANASLLPALACLVGAIGRIPPADLIGMYGDCRSLSNLANFVRNLCEYRIGKELVFAQALPTLDATCERLIACVNSERFADAAPGPQSLSNLISFVGLCDRRLAPHAAVSKAPTSTASSTSTLVNSAGPSPLVNSAGPDLPDTSRTRYARAAELLVKRLLRKAPDQHASDKALAGLLAGLNYVWESELIPRSAELKSYVAKLLALAAKLPSSAWRDKSRASLLPTLLEMFGNGLSGEAATRPLLAALGASDDIRAAIAAIKVVEDFIEPLPLPVQPVAATAPTADSKERVVPGLTPLRKDPAPKTASAIPASSLFPAYPAAPAGKNSSTKPDWQEAKRVSRHPPSSSALLHTAPIVIPAASGKRKVLPPKDKIVASKAEPTMVFQPSTSAQSSGKNARPNNAANKAKNQSPKRAPGAKPGKSRLASGGKPPQTAEAAILAGDLARLGALLREGAPWTAERIARVIDGIQTGALVYEEEIDAALFHFLDTVMAHMGVTARLQLLQHFVKHPPQSQFVWNRLDHFQLIAPRAEDEIPLPKNAGDSVPLFDSIISGNSAAIASHLAHPDIAKHALLNDHSYGDNALILAASVGNTEVVNCLLSLPTAPEQAAARNRYTATALVVAADLGHERVVELLLAHKATADKQIAAVQLDESHALMLAAQKGHLKVVEALLAHKATADAHTTAVTSDGSTALMFAAYNGHLGIVQALLAHKATADAQTTSVTSIGFNPLMLAAQGGHLEVVKALLAHKTTADAQIMATDSMGLNALMIASQYGHAHIARLLLAQQATADRQSVTFSSNGANALMVAAQNGQLKVVEVLLAHKATADAQTLATGEAGFNALMIASQFGHDHIVRLLLARKATADIQSIVAELKGCNALMIAAQLGQRQIVETLLAHKATADTQTTAVASSGFNALMIAAQNGHPDVAEALLAHKATADAQTIATNPIGFNALMIASQYGHDQIVRILLEQQATADLQTSAVASSGANALMVAVQYGQLKVVEALLKHKATANAQTLAIDVNRFNALTIATSHGHDRTVSLLLANQATADAQTTAVTSHGFNALMHGVQNNHFKIVDALLEYKGTADAQTIAIGNTGFNALMIAANLGYEKIVERLLAHQPTAEKQMEASTQASGNALAISAANGRAEALRILLDHAAKKNDFASHKKEISLLWKLAASSGHLNVIDVLSTHPLAKAGRMAADESGATPLWHAAKAGHDQLFEALIPPQGDNSSSADQVHQWWNAIATAVNFRRTSLVKRLLDYPLASEKIILQNQLFFNRLLNLAKHNKSDDIIATLTQKTKNGH